VPTWRRR